MQRDIIIDVLSKQIRNDINLPITEMTYNLYFTQFHKTHNYHCMQYIRQLQKKNNNLFAINKQSYSIFWPEITKKISHIRITQKPSTNYYYNHLFYPPRLHKYHYKLFSINAAKKVFHRSQLYRKMLLYIIPMYIFRRIKSKKTK